MSQRHLDRLRAMDASFLLQEGPSSHAHVGGVATIAAPAPTLVEICAQLTSRLHLMPRYRQRLAHTRLDRARPLWVDDTRFDLMAHVHGVTLDPPGDRAQLNAAIADAYARPLDRTRPLWEIWLVDGLEDDRAALIFKTHHAMVDGSAAIDLLKIFCDLTPDAERGAAVPWRPQPTPAAPGLLAHGARGAAGAALRVAAGALRAARTPRQSATEARAIVEGAGGLIRELLRTPPCTPLTTEIGPDRRFVSVGCRLDDVKLVKNTFGGTVNDVALASVTGALRRFLIGRGIDTEGLELSALVPVSVRDERHNGHLGNRIAVLRGLLPVYVEDPHERLKVVRASMQELKQSTQAPATEFVLAAQDFLPPIVLPLLTRVNVSPRMFNVIVTNIPGPQQPLYVLGRELLELVPIALLQPSHALAIAVASYNGQLNFGVLGDYDTMADIEVVADGIASELDTLVTACPAAPVVTGRFDRRAAAGEPVPV